MIVIPFRFFRRPLPHNAQLFQVPFLVIQKVHPPCGEVELMSRDPVSRVREVVGGNQHSVLKRSEANTLMLKKTFKWAQMFATG